MKFEEELAFLKEQILSTQKIDKIKDYENIVIAGMGGSGIAGKIFQELYTDKPMALVDDYNAPMFLSKKTIFLAMSYSGNTEETLSSTLQAIQAGSHVVTISAGGKLADYGDQHIRIPRSDLNPRSALGYMLMPLLNSINFASAQEVKKTYNLLADLDKDNSECKIHAKKIAEKEMIPVIYGSSPFKNVAYRWKTQFNENAKILAYSSSFPELNHNDTMALAGTYKKSGFYFFAFESEHPRVKKRIAITPKLTDSNFNVITPKGKSIMEKLFYLIHYGDYVSYHLGILRNKDPSDVSLITELKRQMG